MEFQEEKYAKGDRTDDFLLREEKRQAQAVDYVCSHVTNNLPNESSHF
jgi:hypothetical protein